MRHLGRWTSILIMTSVLAACGGGIREASTDRRIVSTSPIAFGPITKACLQSDRKKKSRALCSCIQAAANKTLTKSEQRRSVAFYNNPHMAQQIRQSDRPQDEKFWDAYAAYGREAQKMCG